MAAYIKGEADITKKFTYLLVLLTTEWQVSMCFRLGVGISILILTAHPNFGFVLYSDPDLDDSDD